MKVEVKKVIIAPLELGKIRTIQELKEEKRKTLKVLGDTQLENWDKEKELKRFQDKSIVALRNQGLSIGDIIRTLEIPRDRVRWAYLHGEGVN